MVSKNLFSHYKKYLSFVIVLFFGFSCADSTKKTVYYNASGYTIESDSLLSFSTLVVDGQKVFAVGGDDLASKYLDIPSVTVLILRERHCFQGS